MQYYTLLTNSGRNKLVAAHANNTLLEMKDFAIGDGDGEYYQPQVTQASLINETFRSSISKIYIDPNYANRLIIECLIPATSGGYYIREVGIFDGNRELIAVGVVPESYKPTEDEGSTRDFCIRVIIEVDNIENVNLIIDSNISIVSKDYLENLHNKDVNAHFRLIDADKTDGHHAGNDENNLAVANGQVCNSLNADLLDGHHAGNQAHNVLVLDESGIVPEENLKPYANKEHTHDLTQILTSEKIHSFDNMHIQSGLNEGTTTYVYPPIGFTMNDLLAFIPSIRTIYFSGVVNGDDSLYCYWTKDETKVTIICYNSEQRYTPTVNWLAIWRKNIPTGN